MFKLWIIKYNLGLYNIMYILYIYILYAYVCISSVWNQYNMMCSISILLTYMFAILHVSYHYTKWTRVWTIRFEPWISSWTWTTLNQMFCPGYVFIFFCFLSCVVLMRLLFCCCCWWWWCCCCWLWQWCWWCWWCCHPISANILAFE